MAALVVVTLTGFGLWRWTHPTVFGDLGDSIVAAPRPVAKAALSSTVVFPQIGGEPETVTIDDARPVFGRNTAEATAAFFICHPKESEKPGIGAVHEPANFCKELEPVEPGTAFRYGLEPASDYMIVTITPTRPGVAHLTHIELSYQRGARHFFQQGTESIRVDRKVVAE
ncbi:hypothetical protein GCM10027273_26070 [Nocardioides pakistanensis]